MFNNNLSGKIFFTVITFIVMTLGVNFANASEGSHKMGGKATSPEHEYEHVERPMCPSCKEVRVGPEKGRTTAKMVMECPDCKSDVSEFAVHRCEACEKDVLLCTMCKKVSAELKAEATEAKCPKCKIERTRPIKGATYAKWKMTCPDCKKDTQEWLIQHCNTCDKDFLACPMCKKAYGKTKS